MGKQFGRFMLFFMNVDVPEKCPIDVRATIHPR